MTEEVFKQVLDLKDRIRQLEMVKKYMERFFECKPFSIAVDVSIYGQSKSDIFSDLNGRPQIDDFKMNTDDTLVIIKAINSRIVELKREIELL